MRPERPITLLESLPDTDIPNKAIKAHVEENGPIDWPWLDHAKDLYNMESNFRFYFFQPKLAGDYQMPQSAIGFEKENVNTLAYYSLVRDAISVPYRIIYNILHMERSRWSLYETLLHEMTHLYVENRPDLPKHAKGHGKYFTSVCEEMGLHPRLGVGSHMRIADGQFEALMNRWGIEKPKEAGVVVPKDKPKDNYWDFGKEKPKGGSTLTLYEAEECAKKPVCKIRSGRKDLAIACLDCKGLFVPRLNF